jgi:hypothetical protein
VFASDAKRARRIVRSLGVAAYGHARVNLTIYGEQMHGATASNRTLVIMLEDHMEPSPLHALWFMIQWCALDQPNRTAIAGGGVDPTSATGLAMAAELWDGFVRWATPFAANDTTHSSITDAAVTYLSQLPNASIVLPATKGGVFVRDEWQNPAYVEHQPKLVRAWDPAKEPSWGAVERRV